MEITGTLFSWTIGIANNTIVVVAYAAEMAGVGNFVGAAYVFTTPRPSLNFFKYEPTP